METNALNPNDVLFVGVKNQVVAISKRDGERIWTSELPSMMGSDFVTVICDGTHIFAHASGKVHCLDLTTGNLLWTNELKGCGYGIASLSFSNGVSAPDLAALQTLLDLQRRPRAGAGAGGGH